MRRFGIDHTGNPLDIADIVSQYFQFRVVHQVGKVLVSQHTVWGQCRVNWVQAGRDLHPFGLIDGIAIGHVDAGFLQRRAAIGKLSSITRYCGPSALTKGGQCMCF